jgi:hypothetical protein
VEDAERSALRWVATRYDSFSSDRVLLRQNAPRLWRCLDTRFHRVEAEVDSRALFRRRCNGKSAVQKMTPVLHACAPPWNSPRLQSVKHHMLFNAPELPPLSIEWPEPRVEAKFRRVEPESAQDDSRVSLARTPALR